MARYVLDAAEELSLVVGLMEVIPKGDHEVVAVCVNGESPFSDLARAVEARVFMEALGDPWEVLADDFEGAEDQSWFFLCIDRFGQKPTGALRVVEHGPVSFPCVRHLAEPPHSLTDTRMAQDFGWDVGRMWEVGTLAVDPRYRAAAQASVTTALLYRALYAGALSNDRTHLISIVVPRTLKKLRDLGIPFERMPDMPMKVFWDGAEYDPVIAEVAQFDTHMRQRGADMVSEATSDSRRAVARYKEQLIDALLTGRGLDESFAYQHGPLASVAVG